MYIRNNIKELLPYSTARDDYKGGDISVWLDANESPYNNGVNRYPDPHQKALKGEIAQLKGVTPEQKLLAKASNCCRLKALPVGLLGEHTHMSLVLASAAASMAGTLSA